MGCLVIAAVAGVVVLESADGFAARWIGWGRGSGRWTVNAVGLPRYFIMISGRVLRAF